MRTGEELVPASRETTSAFLARLLAELPGDSVTIGAIVRRLRRRSFGGLLIVLAALGLLPGVSVVAGLAMVIPGTQMVLGFRAPLLPRFIRRRPLSVARLRALGERALPWIERLERYVRPRWLVCSAPPMPQLIGVLVIGLGLVMTLPVPFSNLPSALALLFLSLGLLERDGRFVLLGLVTAVAALLIGTVMTVLALEGVAFFWERHFGGAPEPVPPVEGTNAG